MDKLSAGLSMVSIPLWLNRNEVSCSEFRKQHKPTDSERIRAKLASRIRLWREESDWSLEAASKRLGVSPSTINLWENGKRFPNLENLIALSMLIGEKPCQLMCPDHLCDD